MSIYITILAIWLSIGLGFILGATWCWYFRLQSDIPHGYQPIGNHSADVTPPRGGTAVVRVPAPQHATPAPPAVSLALGELEQEQEGER